MKQRVLLSIDGEVHKQFKKYCEERGMKMSPKIELLIKELIKK